MTGSSATEQVITLFPWSTARVPAAQAETTSGTETSGLPSAVLKLVYSVSPPGEAATVTQVILVIALFSSSRVTPLAQSARLTTSPLGASRTVYVVMTGSSAGTVPVTSSSSFLSTVRVPKFPAQSETTSGTETSGLPSAVLKLVYSVSP